MNIVAIHHLVIQEVAQQTHQELPTVVSEMITLMVQRLPLVHREITPLLHQEVLAEDLETIAEAVSAHREIADFPIAIHAQ